MGMTFLARRLGRDEFDRCVADPEQAGELLMDDDVDEGRALDLDQAWQAVHFWLTGLEWDTTPGAGAAVLGGRPVGGDVGYGPPRLLDPSDVAAVAAGLDAVDVDERSAAWDAEAAAEIYPPGVWTEPEAIEEIEEVFGELREFYRAAADAGEAVVLGVT